MPSKSFRSYAADNPPWPPEPFNPSEVTWFRVWERQPRPYERPLPFHFYRTVGAGAGSSYANDYVTQYAWGNSPFAGDPIQEAINIALERLDDLLGDKASLGATVAEYQSSFDMISERALQLYHAVKRARRGDIRGAARGLNLKGLPTKVPTPIDGRKVSRKAGGTWLEYWFGWSPLIGDIHSAVKILGQDIDVPPTFRTRGRSSSSQDYTYTQSWGAQDVHYGDCKVDVLLQTKASISDANQKLASALGIVNPFEVAWELVPFSWLVDWFGNVGAFLHQFSWLDGVTLRDPFHTIVVEGKEGNYSRYNGNIWTYRGKTVIDVQRRLGLPDMKIRFAPLDRLSVTRAATSVSLLLQQLK